jgi:iron uptake system component EfeO
MNGARVGAVVAAGAVLAGLLAACGGGDDDAAAGPSASDTAANSSASGAKTVTVTLTNDGCTPDVGSVDAGAITFVVKNTTGTAVSELELRSDERILGEKENLAPGFSGNFSLKLDGGAYTLYCPGATTDTADFTVTGTASNAADESTADLLEQGTTQYASYVNSQIGMLVDATSDLVDAVHGGDLDAAAAAYAKARPYYERIEPVAESFKSDTEDLDAAIDARDGDVPAADWGGFHKLEKGIFADKSLDGLDPVATKLLSDVKKLQTLAKDLKYQPAELLNGAGGLLDEVSQNKITGEEERYSHIDVLDFQANVEGAEQAFAFVKPALTKIDPELTTSVAEKFAAVDTLLDKYRSNDDLGGFVLFTDLSNTDIKSMGDAVAALKDPLAQAGAKVAAA